MQGTYSIMGNSEKAFLFLKFADEEGFAQLDLTVKNQDLLIMVTTKGTATEYRRAKNNKDLTEYNRAKKVGRLLEFYQDIRHGAYAILRPNL